MPIPVAGPLTTDLIAEEIGYTQGIQHNLAGPLKSDNSPGTYSLSYFFRNGNVSTSGVPQSAPFGMSAFYGQEAIYRCVSFTSSGAVIGTASVVTYYKTIQTITFSSDRKSFCIRQNWDGSMAISNMTNGTYSLGSTCSAITGQSVASSVSVYTTFGVKVYSVGGYDINGNITAPLAFSASTALTSGTFSNLWWANPNSNSADGRLNRTGLWNSINVPTTGTPQNNYGGFGYLSFSINADVTRAYYIGIGGDNYVTIKVDGATCISQTGSNPGSNNDWNFKYWHIYPVTFSAGLRRLDIINYNEPASQGSLGVDVYGNSFSSLQSVFNNAQPSSSATPSGLDLMYTSSSFRNSGTFFQNLSIDCPLVSPTTTTTTTTTSTTTTTTTTFAGFATVHVDATQALNITITDVTVNGISISGASFPLTTGNTTQGDTSQLGSGISIAIQYTSSISGQHINVTDSNSTVSCQNYGVGTGTLTFTGQQVTSGVDLFIEAIDGPC